ncbi:MAG TPA: transglutaminase family protein, partial [Chthoniobacterales bacterium]|nr:transglutaminase family protein [Chthoniobacterales bacterium]
AWPLLSETPSIGGSTSRFVDSSVERLEFCATSEFHHQYALYVNGRELPFRPVHPKELVAGLRYRKSAFYPSLHPQIGIHLPLSIALVERETDQVQKLFRLDPGTAKFVEFKGESLKRGAPCESAGPGMYTCDLRIEPPAIAAIAP